ncbi:protein phosphatase 1 regulatory subunit 42 [Paragonimus heterotremus]|uniref:Protein phosphatase 1 regulatory subunit 42 n=1 Tax=Paragonimus heterotremus TaxID=100268 RepID=A0A8J4SLT4_9TREM|nr:protein phosphatase 1 regulatory subunit 42 [Paragonimus heterotremus]
MVKSSVALLCKSTSNLKKRKIDQTPEQYLKQITHLYLNGKRLDELGPELSLCKNLNVLYLYDNALKEIPDLSVVPQLTHLYLQNNHISRIDNLSSLSRLEKLFLSRNCITVVEGLEGLSSLHELRVDNQRLTPGESLLFDDQTVISLAKNLTRLDVAGNYLDSLEDFIPLSCLSHFCASNNQLDSITELTKVLSSWPRLKQLELYGNPVMSKPRARDAIIISSKSLEILDDKLIPQPTRRFLENWNQFKGFRLEASEAAMKPTQSPVGQELASQVTDLSGPISTSFETQGTKRLVESGFESPQGEVALWTDERKDLIKKLGETDANEQRESFEQTAPSDRGEVRDAS